MLRWRLFTKEEALIALQGGKEKVALYWEGAGGQGHLPACDEAVIIYFIFHPCNKILFLMDTDIENKPFHHAMPSNNLAKSKEFYGEILQCPQGRIDPARWIDYNFFGSQIVTHFASSEYVPITHMVGNIPVPSYGADVTHQQYLETKQKLDKHNVKY